MTKLKWDTKLEKVKSNRERTTKLKSILCYFCCYVIIRSQMLEKDDESISSWRASLGRARTSNQYAVCMSLIQYWKFTSPVVTTTVPGSLCKRSYSKAKSIILIIICLTPTSFLPSKKQKQNITRISSLEECLFGQIHAMNTTRYKELFTFETRWIITKKKRFNFTFWEIKDLDTLIGQWCSYHRGYLLIIVETSLITKCKHLYSVTIFPFFQAIKNDFKNLPILRSSSVWGNS